MDVRLRSAPIQNVSPAHHLPAAAAWPQPPERPSAAFAGFAAVFGRNWRCPYSRPAWRSPETPWRARPCVRRRAPVSWQRRSSFDAQATARGPAFAHRRGRVRQDASKSEAKRLTTCGIIPQKVRDNPAPTFPNCKIRLAVRAGMLGIARQKKCRKVPGNRALFASLEFLHVARSGDREHICRSSQMRGRSESR
jgi:hypothetical protein